MTSATQPSRPVSATSAPLPHLTAREATPHLLWHWEVHAPEDVRNAPRGPSILVGQKGHCDPLLPGPASASNTVHVVLLPVWRIEVDDKPHGLDVEAPGCHVGGHEHSLGTCLEEAECLVPLTLVLVTVDDDTVLRAQRHRLAHALGVHKDDGLVVVRLPQNAIKALLLFTEVATADDTLLDIGVHPQRVHLANSDLNRIPHELCSESPHRGRPRGREHHSLPLLRQLPDHLPDLRLESHVEHPVGLVKDKEIHTLHADHTALEEVVEAAGRADGDLATLSHGLQLGHSICAAVYRADTAG
mmetsp:Transcript_66725/g.201419  ORF Transcript_66725/g.201419 Transcript_66725/m.201419 type:complete len:301 (+) Transcript_66725:564-1466(+)